MESNFFWEETFDELRRLPLNLEVIPIKDPQIEKGKAFSISFQSLYGEKIYGVLLVPDGQGKFPVVLDIIGYMTHIQKPSDFSHWLDCGCGCLVIDNRDQGGKTIDSVPYLTVNNLTPMGRGLLMAKDSYMRRIVADQIRLFDVIDELSQLDQNRIILHGNSQGGGLALLVNGICQRKILATFANVPSHSNIAQRITEGTGSYGVVKEYLNENPLNTKQVLTALKHFDTQYYAKNIHNPVYISVASDDPICPMKDFFVTYHQISSPKELTVFWGKGHEGGERRRLMEEMRIVKQIK
ncbi:acetylxylan esterase [Enterococcus songbeiensis]|uniref:acetylxylan esterase n=1 Tax=Enterococcus songbeiensis TaxID=2559927 RepID=UPI0014858F24|nr:acetylxylan esterase [Enterococcus songbeiensis]